jgi:AcrR family transcriptional regulator
VTKEETRAELLAAAATVFAAQGYDGASVNDITQAAGLSTASIYAHFSGKAELFAALLAERAPHELDRALGDPTSLDVAALFAALGTSLPKRSAAGGSLLVEAIVAAKRDPDIARLLRSHVNERERALASLVTLGQAEGELDPGTSPTAVARLSMMVVLGSLLIRALGLPATDRDEWAALMERLVEVFREPPHQQGAD